MTLNASPYGIKQAVVNTPHHRSLTPSALIFLKTVLFPGLSNNRWHCRGLILSSTMRNVNPQQCVSNSRESGTPWRNGLKRAISWNLGQNTWTWLLSSLTPGAPSLFSFYSSRSSSPPCPSTSLLLHRTLCLWVHESLHFTIPNSQLTTNPTTASIIEAPLPPYAFITMTTHNEGSQKESKGQRKIAEAEKKNLNERVGVPSVDLWFHL